jgi:hypothetical protein
MTGPLNEQEIRAKVIELLDGCNQVRLELWMVSGVRAGVLDHALVERVMLEEIGRRSTEVTEYWLKPCNCDGAMN